MKEFEVRENKATGILGIICLISFTTLAVLSFLYGNKEKDILLLVLSVFIFLFGFCGGLSMTLSYFLRKIVVRQNIIYYRNMFGRKSEFTVYEICKCVVRGRLGNESYRLYSTEGKILARFELNMDAVDELIFFLVSKNILLEEKKRTVKSKRKKKIGIFGKVREKYNRRKQSDRSRSMNYIKSKWDYKQIEKMRTIVRVLSVVLIILLVASSLFLPRQITILFGGMVLIFWYALYLILYPLMVTDRYVAERRWEKRHIDIPIVSIFISVGIMKLGSETMKVVTAKPHYIFIVSVTVLLFFLFAIVTYKKDKRARIGNKLWALIVIAFLVWASADSVQSICTVKKPVQEKAKIVDATKDDEVLLTIKLQNRKTIELYLPSESSKSIKKGDSIDIQRKESIFGVIYYQIDP